MESGQTSGEEIDGGFETTINIVIKWFEKM